MTSENLTYFLISIDFDIHKSILSQSLYNELFHFIFYRLDLSIFAGKSIYICNCLVQTKIRLENRIFNKNNWKMRFCLTLSTNV